MQSTIFALIATELKIIAEIETVSDLCLMSRTGNEADVEKSLRDHRRSRARAKGAERASAKAERLRREDTARWRVKLAAEDHGAAAQPDRFDGANGLRRAEVARRRRWSKTPSACATRSSGARPGGRTGDDATACVFSVNDAPGALLDVLRLFAERAIARHGKNQSRPSPDWSYLFFVEVSGHATDRPLVSAFEEVRHKNPLFQGVGFLSEQLINSIPSMPRT